MIADSESLGVGLSRTLSSLKHAEARKAKSVVLRINSPGGTVAACQELYSAVSRLKEKGIPVVASLGDVAASGGVYVAMAANRIIANPGTVTGSIGVIIRSSNLSALYQKIGVSAKIVKSGPHKDMLSTHRSFSAEEEKLLQGVIDDTHQQFIEAVHLARDKDIEEVKQLADGRIMTGKQALESGLVDALGGMNAALDAATELGRVAGKPRVLVIQPRKRLWQRLFRPVFTIVNPPGLELVGIPLWLLPTGGFNR